MVSGIVDHVFNSSCNRDSSGDWHWKIGRNDPTSITLPSQRESFMPIAICDVCNGDKQQWLILSLNFQQCSLSLFWFKRRKLRWNYRHTIERSFWSLQYSPLSMSVGSSRRASKQETHVCPNISNMKWHNSLQISVCNRKFLQRFAVKI